MLTLPGFPTDGLTLRTALGLSAATGKPFRIDAFRSSEEKPGLMRRHLTAIRAVAAVCGAEMVGADIGATAFSFAPGGVRAGEYRFAVAAGGSAVRLLLAVLPPLLVAEGPSVVAVEGGTHVPGGPSPEFLELALLPLLARMGPAVTLAVERAGFCPAAGGRIVARVSPAAGVPKLSPLHLTERGQPGRRTCKAIVAGLSGEIALRELDLVRRRMDWPEESFQIRQLPDDQGPGNAVVIELGSEHVTEVFAAAGQRGTTAEAVAEAVLQEAQAYLASGVPAGQHLADALLVPLALAGGGSVLTTRLNAERLAAVEVARAFVGRSATVTDAGKDRSLVSF